MNNAPAFLAPNRPTWQWLVAVEPRLADLERDARQEVRHGIADPCWCPDPWAVREMRPRLDRLVGWFRPKGHPADEVLTSTAAHEVAYGHLWEVIETCFEELAGRRL